MATEKRLIDANALIESGYDVKLDEVFPDWEELPDSTKEAVCKHGQYLKKLINDQPTVDAVEVVHGQWIHPKGHVVSNEFLCSECGHGETSYHAIKKLPGGGLRADESGNFFYPPKMNYCPNCGAKMDGDGNG